MIAHVTPRKQRKQRKQREKLAEYLK